MILIFAFPTGKKSYFKRNRDVLDGLVDEVFHSTEGESQRLSTLNITMYSITAGGVCHHVHGKENSLRRFVLSACSHTKRTEGNRMAQQTNPCLTSFFRFSL